MRRAVVLGTALAELAALLPASAGAAAWGVNDTTDTPIGQACAGFTDCSLREAVTSAEANPGPDTVLVSAGTYVLANGQLTVTQTLDVAAVGAGSKVIDGGNASRIFDVTGGTFTVRFVTLTHGLANAGGGTGEGGAIRTGVGVDLHVEGAVLSANTATGAAGARGGAISAQGPVTVGTVSPTRPSLTQNTATSSGGLADGGAIAVRGASLTISSATISANTATGANARGGAIFADTATTLTDSALATNHATGASAYGGAVAMDSASLGVTRSTLSANTATGTGAGLTTGGGAVAALPGLGASALTLTTSTLADNTAEISGALVAAVAAGGAVYNDTAGGTTATNSTVTGNTVTATGASTAQGSAFSGSGSGGALTLGSSIVAENSSGSQCAQTALTSSGYNVLGSFAGCSGAPIGTDTTGVTDAGLSVLGAHGGLTPTRLADTPSSVALDRIPSGSGGCSGAAVDQRGVSRLRGSACEVGAAESAPAVLNATPSTRIWGNVSLSTGANVNVAVSNSGEIETPAPGFAVAAPFSVTGCGAVIAGGSNCIATIRAAPTVAGTFNTTLTVTSGALSDTVTLDAVGFGPTTLPAITSSGGVLSVSDGVWTGSPTGFVRQWVRCDADGTSNCVDLAGQTAATYATIAADDGHRLRVRVFAHSATIDSDPVTTAPSGVIGATSTNPRTPTTPAVAPESPTDATLRCTGRELAILDFRPKGRKVTVRGLALSRRAGQRVTLRAGSRALASATVAADGSFTATVTLPRSGRRPRVIAQIADSVSLPFAVERRFAILSRKRAGTRVRITARVTGGKRGATVTLRRQVSCGKTARYGTARLGRGGRFTIALPLPSAREGIALYRAVAPIAGGTTFTLPIAVTASG